MQDDSELAGKFERTPQAVNRRFLSRSFVLGEVDNRPDFDYRSDNITVTVIPEKKGSFLKHTEYEVWKNVFSLSSRVTQAAALFQITSDKFKSKVERRYSDFDKLYSLMLVKYSNRMIPRIPPKQMLELYLEDRRKGLHRWLRLIAQHKAISNDEMFRSFMTKKSPDIQNHLDSLFDDAPDELTSTRSIEMMPPVDKGVLSHQHDRLCLMLSQIVKIKLNIDRQQKREAEQSKDFAAMAHVLSSMDQKGLDDISKNFKEIAGESDKAVKNQQETVMERLDMIIDALQGHSDMCDRIEKKFNTDSSFSQPSSMRSRLQGAVRTPSNEAVALLEAERERQNVFAMFCLGQETRHAEHYLKLIPSILLQFSHKESNIFTNIAQAFNKIITNESDKLNSG